jgi:flagellar basal-body rod modification protein FlgD
LFGDAVKGKVSISDETGKTIKEFDTGMLKKGQNRVVWNGTDKDEREVKAGRYFFSIEAENNSGKKIGVQTETSGLITGVNYSAEGPLLLVGDQAVRLSDIQKIEDDSLRAAQNQKDEGGIPQAAKDALVKKAQEVYNSGAAQPPQASKAKPKVIPENKPKAELQGSVLPLEVASGNSSTAGKLGGSGISTGGAFGRK